MTAATQLRHDALFYDTDDQFAAVLVPFIQDGLGRGQAVTVAVTQHNIALLRVALGADAAAINFIDRDDWYRRPAATIRSWQRMLDQAHSGGYAEVRLIGEVAFGPAERHVSWTRYESALNAVFADAPAWIVCPYDTRGLPAGVVTDARRTHPTVREPDRHGSTGYQPAAAFLRAVPEPMPPVAARADLRMPLDGDVPAARAAIARHMLATGHQDWAGLQHLLLASSEIITNAIRHGTGRRVLQLWILDGAVMCEVTDEGGGPGDPLVGYRGPDPSAPGGRGLWLARQVCDGLAIDTDGTGTRVRFCIAGPDRPARRSAYRNNAGSGSDREGVSSTQSSTPADTCA